MNQPKTEAVKQRIHHLIELRKMIITAIIVVLGGLATIFLALDTWRREAILLTAGIIVFIVLWVLNREIAIDVEKLIKKMAGENV